MNPAMKQEKKWNIFAEVATPFNMDQPTDAQWSIIGAKRPQNHDDDYFSGSVVMDDISGRLRIVHESINHILTPIRPSGDGSKTDIYVVPAEFTYTAQVILADVMRDAIKVGIDNCAFFTNNLDDDEHG